MTNPKLTVLDSSQVGTTLTEVGILHISVYYPRTAVSQAELERFDHAPKGKYTIGLGQTHMSYVSDREDVISLALTAVSQLMHATSLPYSAIGRLDVGTETILDKSKSIKSSLMRLFEESGNSEVAGLDSTNACYGATESLFNALAWAESSAWDGRYAIVVASDIAVYAPGPARPTGGAAAVAMLIGRGSDVPIRFEIGLRATCMGNSYDFFKPNMNEEYPVVRGQETVDTYVFAMDECYRRYGPRASKRDDRIFDVRTGPDYCVFHAPFNKMVQKSFARLLYKDFLATPPGSNSFYETVERFRGMDEQCSHRDKQAVRAFVALGEELFAQKCTPAAWLAKEIGNCYTASLYSSLAALIHDQGDDMLGKRVLLYSFGSGFAASMYSLKVTQSVQQVVVGDNLRQRLKERIVASPEEYVTTLKQRELDYGRVGYQPQSSVRNLFPGTWYLKEVAEDGARDYDQVPFR